MIVVIQIFLFFKIQETVFILKIFNFKNFSIKLNSPPLRGTLRVGLGGGVGWLGG